MLRKTERAFIALATLFCVNLALTHLVTPKLFKLPFLALVALSVADLTYPVTFLVTDIVSEVWSERRAKFIVLLGFFVNLFMFFAIKVVLYATPQEYWGGLSSLYGGEHDVPYPVAYEAVFNSTFFLVPASIVAYIVAQMMNIRLFSFLKKKTKGRHLWLRNNVSTMASQFVDVVIFNMIFSYIGLGLDLHSVVLIIIYSYKFKLICAAVDTPILYFAVSMIRSNRDKESSFGNICYRDYGDNV